MSLRTFTVFQDSASSDAPPPKVSRPNAMTTRSASLKTASSGTTSGELAVLDKENYNPVTGERAGPSNATKKRKTTVLSTKVQPTPTTKSKKEKGTQLEPEQKKRKASASSTTKSKSKKEVKGSGSAKKTTSKRSGSSKVTPMPSLNEEEEGEKDRTTQANIDSRCYDLTVKPLADVSQAYDEPSIFDRFADPFSAGSEDKVRFGTVKASSVEPEIRDYFQPSQALFSSSSRLRAFSEDLSEPRTFSTPERKQIYAAFTFCSPSASTTITSKASTSGTISPTEEL